MLTIAAVVATHNRPELLAERALASIATQSRPPDYLVVVDDSDADIRRANAEVVAGLGIPGTGKVYLDNLRTPGASGAWNTALYHVHAIDASAFVAILDDDDSWDTTYLERCEQAVLNKDLDMVAAGLVVHRFQGYQGQVLDPPARLDVGDLLVRNPHIQGSNLFARLRRLLEAGGFDEAMTSTTDRDICIRLADLGTVKYGALNEHLVHHFANDDRPRLSTPGSDAKRAGLKYFYHKYQGRMSPEQRAAFIGRSLRLFHCDPTEEFVVPDAALPASEFSISEKPLALVVGAITSPDTSLVERLLNSLAEKIGGREEVTLKIVLLENGGHAAASRQALRDTVSRATEQGLHVVVKTLEEQADEVEAGVFNATGEQLSRRKSIALSRTMLQHYLFMEAKPLPGAVAWILDDDVVLEGLGHAPGGLLQSHDVEYVSEITRLKESGASIVLCEVTGDPPLPVLSCVRTQLVDLYHNLHRLATLPPESPFPDSRDENRLARLENPDYYYDLSSSGTSLLELPFWYEAEGERTSWAVLRELVARLPGVLSGVQIFRPLVRSERNGTGYRLSSSINRGPATLVFDLQALREFPNAVPAVNGTDIRRSDMVWSLLNRFAGGREVFQATLPVRQVRNTKPNTGSIRGDFTTIEQDLLGHAFYSSLRDLLEFKAEHHRNGERVPRGNRLLESTDDEIEMATRLYRKHLDARVSSFELSYIRVMGLISALKPFCQALPDTHRVPWWLVQGEYEDASAALRAFVANLESIYTDDRLHEFKRRVADMDVAIVEDFLRQLPAIVDRYRENTPLPIEELQQSAEQYVREEFATGPLTCLGIGEEGVVLTDRRLVYKYFHYWKARDRSERIAFLESLVGRITGYQTLPDLLEVRDRGNHVVVVYPYEEGVNYEGGHLEWLLTLLRETRQAGIACRNIHPDNLLVTSSGLKFIDYGSDVVPGNEAEFEHMCRRAYLTYRFPFRSDLRRLMTQSLTDPTLPELIGLDQFRRALDPRGLEEIYYRPMADMIAKERPHSVLDYGCGDGRLTEEFASRGVDVVGYDPDPAIISRCLERGGQAVYGGRELLERLFANNARFDTVVCGRVLCTIADDSEFEEALTDLRRLVSDTGTALVAVCNPFHLSVESTELSEKHIPSGCGYEDTFVYDKTVTASGSTRSEVHRSYSVYWQAFAKAGLLIEEVTEFDGADTKALLPSSDHLVFRLTPAPVDGPRVSLLIKTCAMEWRTCQWRRENGPLGRSKSVPPGAVGQHKCPHQLFREMSYRRAGQQKVGGKVLVRPILGQACLEVGMQRSAGSA